MVANPMYRQSTTVFALLVFLLPAYAAVAQPAPK